MRLSEEWWVERWKEGDPVALEEAIEIYGSDVFHLVKRILPAGNKEDIEECVSDVFVAAWRKMLDYDPERGSFRTWLLILAKYKALDVRRSLAKHPVSEEFNTELQSQENTEHAVLVKVENEEILGIVDSFDPVDRNIFYKRYFYYEPLETIARNLGLTRKAVENRLRRARIALKNKLKPNLKEELE